MNYMSNDLQKKANELGTTKYKAELEKKTSNPEEKFKKLEKEINTLLEEATALKLDGKHSFILGNYSDALEKAKEVTNKEKTLRKQR